MVYVFLFGITKPRGMIFVITPLAVSTPRVSGVISMNNNSEYCPPRIPANTAAPLAAASSGLMLLLGSFPLKKSLIRDYIFGIRVEKPTSTISSISDFLKPESSRTV